MSIRVRFSQIHMGVRVTITCHAPDQDVAERASTAAFARFAELDQVMSDYRPSSELMRLCAMAGQGPVKISRDLFVVLRRSQEVAYLSCGALDVTCGPLVRLWREARERRVLPDAETIREARGRCGYRSLVLKEGIQHGVGLVAGSSGDDPLRSAELQLPEMLLDLGGIGKGYACDEALSVLRAHGVGSALVEAGGDIAVSGPPPETEGWRVLVQGDDATPSAVPEFLAKDAEDAQSPQRQGPLKAPLLQKDGTGTLVLANCAVSTSGDFEQHLDIDGVRHSHVIDPRTGLALTDGVQVTVIASDALTSDSLTKVCGVLGPEGSTAILLHFNAKAIYK
ncbi:MAG: FAD:protein FMN transferase [Fimbriimonadales bacterium]